jgi:choline dehydrogenase
MLEYDYVIVGAGSAGCVLTHRLATETEAEILVLEAGEPDDQREIHIPAAFPDLFKTEVDWEYYTEPQSELNDRELYWPRGKALGGSSSINAMIYIRGHPSDYDRWKKMGNDGWGYEDLLPYFKRAEHNERGADEYHGAGGPLNVADQQAPNELSEAFVDAAANAGYHRNDDFNGDSQEGVGRYQVTQKQGERHSAADAYLNPVLDRGNVTALTGAQVTEIEVDDGEATGVKYRRAGGTGRVEATQEVIVSAGAINSPQLLMLSGIGPVDHLTEHDIDVVEDSPGVGKNLQDHLNTFVVCHCSEPVSLDDAESLVNVGKYFALNDGPLTSNIGEAGGFVRTDDEVDVPDVQFHFGPAYFVEHGLQNPETGHGFSLGVLKLRPESRGEIRLDSADPLEDPAIDPAYLTGDGDLETSVEGLKIAREITQTEPLASYHDGEMLPGEDVQTDEELAEFIRDSAETLYHPVGTCKMGDGEEAVVDDHLRVHGVENLRVVDASVMPTITGGNTNAPTIAIAERAAEMIVDQYRDSTAKTVVRSAD